MDTTARPSSLAFPRFIASLLALCALVALGFCGNVLPARADNATYFYDPAGRLTTVVDPVNGSAQYNYDAAGNILSVTRFSTTAIVVGGSWPTSAAAGATITIGGNGFGTTANTTVSFNGVASTPSAVTSTSITVVVPSGAATGPITVKSPAGTGSMGYSFTVVTGKAPTVTAIPSGVTAQGASIAISGTGFDTTAANDIVVINGMHAPVTAATATSLTVTVPSMVSNSKVSVTTTFGTATSSANLVVPPTGAAASAVQSVTSSALGSSPSVSFDGTSRSQLVTFTATQGQLLAFNVTSAASALNGGSASLFTPEGVQLGSSWNLAANTTEGPLTATATGTYGLWLTPPSGASGAVTISLSVAPAPVTQAISANGTPVSLTTTASGQGMALTFSATAGSNVLLNVSFTSGTFATIGLPGDILQIAGPTGQLYSKYYNYSVNQSGASSGTLAIPTNGTGTYTITFTPTYGEMGTAAFTLYNVPPAASSTIAASGSPVSLTTTTPGQSFSLTFSGTVGQTVSLDMKVASGTLGSGNSDSIEITGPTGQQIFSDFMSYSHESTELFSGVLTLPAAGTYTIVDAPTGLETGSMNFTLYTVPPPAVAVLTANGSTTNLTTTAPGQTFAPTFTGTAGEHIALDIKVLSGTLGSNNGDQIAITGPTGVGQIWGGSMECCGTQNEIFSGALTLPSNGAGAYTITDFPNWTGVGQLGFTLYTVPPDATSSITMNGAAVTLSTTTPTQQMVLTFSGTAGQSASMLVQNATGSILSNGGANFNILDPNGNTIYSNSLCYYCYMPSIYTNVLSLPYSGTYKAYFTPLNTGTGGATFNLYNEAPQTGALTPNGGSVGVTTTSPNQVMNLSMSETSGHRVALLVQYNASLSAQGSTLIVTAPDGTTQLTNVSNGAQTSYFTGAMPIPPAVTSTVPLLTQTGVYSVSLSPQGLASGTATFTAYDVPSDLTGAVAVGAAAKSFSLTTPGQSVRATVAGTANQKVSFIVSATTTNPASPCTNVTVLDPDGATVLNGAQSCNASYSTGSLTLPTTGNYLVVATPVVPATGVFTVGATSP